jgi:hypothetical protein
MSDTMLTAALYSCKTGWKGAAIKPWVAVNQRHDVILSKAISKHSGGIHEYTQNTLPDALSGIGSANQAAFGKRIVAFAANTRNGNFFNGVQISENPDVLFLNLNSNQSWVGVLGHERLHAMMSRLISTTTCLGRLVSISRASTIPRKKLTGAAYVADDY